MKPALNDSEHKNRTNKQNQTKTNWPNIIVVMFFISGCSLFSGSQADKKARAEGPARIFFRDQKITQILAQSWERIRLNESREIVCAKAVNCLVFGEEKAEVIYTYDVKDNDFEKRKTQRLLEGQERCVIDTHTLLDIIASQATETATAGQERFVYVTYQTAINAKSAFEKDPFSAEKNINDMSLRCSVDTLWQTIKKRAPPEAL